MKNCAIKSGAQAANLFLGFSWNWRKEIDFSNVIGEKWKKEKKLKLLFILYIGKKLWWKWFFFLLFLRIYFFLGKRETRFEWSLTWHLSESLWKIIWGLYVLKEIRFLKDNLGKTPAISVGKKKKKKKDPSTIAKDTSRFYTLYIGFPFNVCVTRIHVTRHSFDINKIIHYSTEFQPAFYLLYVEKIFQNSTTTTTTTSA